MSAGKSTKKVYHRLKSPTQTDFDAARQEQTGEMWGLPHKINGLVPAVKAYRGPLPRNAKGVEFTTDIEPSGMMPIGAIVRWNLGSPGVEPRDFGGETYAVIKCKVTRNTQK